MDEMIEQLKIQQIQVAILTVPQDVAQDTADRIVEANVRGILNFTPIRLNAPENVRVQNVDLTNELQTLIYFLDNQKYSVERHPYRVSFLCEKISYKT